MLIMASVANQSNELSVLDDDDGSTYILCSGVSTVGPSGARAPLTFSLLNVIIK